MTFRNLMRLCLVALFLSASHAFAPSSSQSNNNKISQRLQQQQPQSQQRRCPGGGVVSSSSTTQLAERQWNFNQGQAPWGLKKNAEIWNGRVAQMAFVLVFLQELIQGKGVIKGISEGDPINLACAGAFAITIVGLTGFLAFKGDDDYVSKNL